MHWIQHLIKMFLLCLPDLHCLLEMWVSQGDPVVPRCEIEMHGKKDKQEVVTGVIPSSVSNLQLPDE